MAGSAFTGSFSNPVKPRGCILWPVWPLRSINKAVWGDQVTFKELDTLALTLDLIMNELNHLSFINVHITMGCT